MNIHHTAVFDGDTDDPGQLNCTEADLVEIILENNRLWVNIDGVCRLRVGRTKTPITLAGSHSHIFRQRKKTAAADATEDSVDG